MTRYLRSARIFALTAIALSFARTAAGAPQDAAAIKLREHAIYTSYLVTDFAAAETELTQALSLCKDAADCEPSVLARIQCDLGSVLFIDQKADEARTHFGLALKLDPNVALDDDLASPDMQVVFAAQKNAAGAPVTAPPPTSSEDITHIPPPEQAVLTPVPLYVALPESVTALKVFARYKATGTDKWKTAPFHRIGAGWGGEIPCLDVGDSPTDLKYFVQATDAEGDLVATAGRLTAPYVVRIVAQLQGEAPHVPGAKPPLQCTRKSDCPPGFPGCDNGPSEKLCASSDDCGAGDTCQDGLCEAAPTAPKKNWITLALQSDLLYLPSAGDACSGGTGYTCFDSGGGYYGGVPLQGQDDTVVSGVAAATMRVLAGYDRVFGQHLMLGGRVGYAFNGGPQRPTASSFLPLHAEARGTWWFGHDPLARAGFRFFVLASGGVAQVDAGVQVDAYATAQALRMGQSQNYNAWKKAGLGFAAEGGGAMYAFTPSTGVVLEVKLIEMFPTPGLGGGVQLGYAVGL
jgi:hypothetical protein